MNTRRYAQLFTGLVLVASAAGCSASPAPSTSNPNTGGTGASAGNSATGGTGGAHTSSGGSSPATGGSGGVAAVSGNGGVAGSSMAGSAGSAGSLGTAGSAGSGGAPAGGCPAGALFCADFEEASGLPAGAMLEAPDDSGMTFDMLMKLDTVLPFNGKQSLAVTTPGAFHYRMLGVTVPSSFWVRLYIKSDMDIGQPDHNAFFVAMTGPDYHSSTTSVEVAEQFSCVLLNQHDALFPTGSTCTVNTALAKNAWHCMEAQFDGVNGNVQIWADKTQIIDAMNWMPAKANFNTFEFGYGNYNTPGATVWYDDVVVATTRVGCP